MSYGGYGGGPGGGGHDWNGNGYRDSGDSYMDYQIMNDKGGGGGSGGGGGDDQPGCGCLLAIIGVVLAIYNLLT